MAECRSCNVLRRRLVAAERRIAYLERRRPVEATLSDDDVLVLTRLLPAIGGAFGSRLFTAKELCARREDSAALRVVLDRSPSSLGQLFARAHGHPVAGFAIEKVGCEGSRAVWRVSQVRDLRDPLVSRRDGGVACSA